MTTAQHILTGGTILTMDPAQPTAEAVALAEGRILAVGRQADILALAETTRVSALSRTYWNAA